MISLITNLQFLGYCDFWQQRGRCPAMLCSWLQSRGLPEASTAAFWAYVAPDRDGGQPIDGKGGIRPFMCLFDDDICKKGDYAWGEMWTANTDLTRSDLPDDVYHQVYKGPFKGFPTFAEAIVAFLAGWMLARPSPAKEVNLHSEVP